MACVEENLFFPHTPSKLKTVEHQLTEYTVRLEHSLEMMKTASQAI